MSHIIRECIIAGAGPAGLQLAAFMEKAQRDYLVLESGSHSGKTFQKFPRHRKLLSINKRYTGETDPEKNMRMDWNSLLSDDDKLLFTNYSDKYFPSADDLVTYLNDFSTKLKLKIQYDTYIENITHKDTFVLTDTCGNTYQCQHLIMATGVSQENIPRFPGSDLIESYATVSVNPKDFINQHVLIIGKGNSAFETADNLIETTAAVHVGGANSIKMAWKTHFVGDLRAVNNNFLDTYQLKSQNALLDGEVVNIEKKGKKFVVTFSFSRANEVKKKLTYDRVISCTGFRFDNTIFDETCKPNMVIDDRFPCMTSSWESSNIPDLYFAGVTMQVRDFKQSTCAFIHGFRYSVGSLFNILNKKYHHVMWPSYRISPTASAIADAIIKRVNTTSALWQQFAFLCDLITLDDDMIRCYEELPIDYVHESDFGQLKNYFFITLEYGPDHAKVDPFDIHVQRVAQNDAETAFNAQYLHPVIRYFSEGKLCEEHHIAENLENNWTDKKAHVIPLQRFFDHILEKTMQKEVA